MSQVDDWSDGYTSDYLRDLNTYGPASANVPRPSSVVSHQVRYRAPDTSDIPLAPGQNPEGSVYSNAPGARMGQTKPASGYRAPAGGGWDVNSSDTNLRFPNESGGKQYRVSRTQAAKKSVKKQAQPGKKQAQLDKKQVQNYGSYKDQSDPLSQHILANGSPEVKPPVESVAGKVQDITDQSDPYRAIAALSHADNAGQSDAGAADTGLRTAGGINPFESDESLAAWKDLKLKSFPILPSEMAGGSPAEAVTRFRQIAADPNSTVADVLTAENEAKKAAVDEGMTMDNIAAFEKEVALNLLFAGAGSAVNALRGVGGAARAASSTGNAWAAGSRAAAGDATAGAKAFEESLSRMNGGAVRGAPTESFARPAASASASWRTGRTAEYPAGTGKFDQFGGWGESGRSAVGTGSAPASDGVARFADTGYGSVGQGAAKTTSTEVAGAGADTGAASAREIMFGADAGAASRTAAGTADGGVSELANAGNAGREAAAAGGQAAGTAGREAAAAGRQAALNKIPEELRAEISARRKALTAANIKPSDILNEISEAMDTGYLSGTTYEVGRKLLQAVQAGGGEALSAGERSIAEAYSKFLQTPKGRMYREDMNW